MRPSVWNVPFGAPVLEVLARDWLKHDEPERGLILLPTRRAARAMATAFLRATGGAPVLLPRVTALGAIDETPLALAGALTIPAAVGEAERLAALSAMILAREPGMGLDRAWALAAELAALVDEAARAGVDLRGALADATGGEHAEHWQQTLRFLAIVTEVLPRHLEGLGRIGPVDRQVALLRAQARVWADGGGGRVWAAGITGTAFPAAGELLRAVAGMLDGRVVLHGLDRAMADDVFATLSEDAGQAGHPQSGLARLLASLGVRREDVRDWPDADPPAGGARANTLGLALLPAPATAGWRALAAGAALPHVRLLRTPNEAREAQAIAMILRDAVEVPGSTAALVTPDRALATRVATALRRWGIVADDSAGEPLAQTPPAVFLRLLAALLTRPWTGEALLAVLRHPLAAAGFSPAQCRLRAREFELGVLRGTRGLESLAALRRASKDQDAAFLDAIERCVAGADALLRAAEAPARAQLAALIEAAELLAGTDDAGGAARLWAGEDGNALADALSEALAALDRVALPDQPARTLPGVLDAMLAPHAVRGGSGRGAEAAHPSVSIWGLLEARLQTADVMVLGGLAEGVWPGATDPGPWMSRPMRTRAGLDSPEEATGRAAHDFVAACCAGADLVLSVPARRGGRPVVPSRWIARIEALLGAAGEAVAPHPAGAWAAALDLPAEVRPAAAPAPRPPQGARPRRMSLSELTLWRHDPYALYAKRILGLRPLDPLTPKADAAAYGEVVHKAIAAVLADAAWPACGAGRLAAEMDRRLKVLEPPRAVAAWWAPRFARIAAWVTDTELARRPGVAARGVEVKGVWHVPGCDLEIVAVADRLERDATGGVTIIDYKTGTVPNVKAVVAAMEPQLPVEAAMAQAGAFGAAFTGPVMALAYWKLSGDHTRGAEKLVSGRGCPAVATLIAETVTAIAEHARAFEDAATPYPHDPKRTGVPGSKVYADLARAAEWRAGAAGEDEAEDEPDA